MICSTVEKERLAIDQILANCVCRSAQGRKLKEKYRLFTKIDRDDLIEEFAAIDDLRKGFKDKDIHWRRIESILGRFRNIEGSLSGIEKERLLDESELFEIKRCLGLIRQISEHNKALEKAHVTVIAQDDAEALLNPLSGPSKGFHIYSSYSERLAKIRKERFHLEAEIARSAIDERKDLLEKRSNLVFLEQEEEKKQIERLVNKLNEHSQLLRKNLENIALLDFRLAKARLAEEWQAPQPQIANNTDVAVVKGAWHPLVRPKLEKKGDKFIKQSIVLPAAATVISGPNMGGKSIALQTFLICLYLVQLGYCPPCQEIKTPLYDFFVYMSDNPGIATAGLSSFGMEAARLREYLRMSEKWQGLLVLDEPCRGTNPQEATAIVTALCRIFAERDSALLVATHYKVPNENGIQHYQIRGLAEVPAEFAANLANNKDREDDDEDLNQPEYKDKKLDKVHPNKITAACGKSREDMEAVRRISSLMDYKLEKVEDDAEVPTGAIRIAELMGVDDYALSAMRAALKEE